MVDGESSLDWQDVFVVFPALLNWVVAGDYNSLWPDEDLTTLGGGLEWVVVGPHLNVVAVDLLRTHLFDDDCLFSFVSIPPDVIGFDEGVWI